MSEFPRRRAVYPEPCFCCVRKREFDGASPSLVPLDDPGDERVLAFRFARQGLFQHLDDVARRQQFEARLSVARCSTMNSIANMTNVTW